jgi:pilus assembly protein CpaF
MRWIVNTKSDLESLKENILKQLIDKYDEFGLEFATLDETNTQKRLEVAVKSILKKIRGVNLTHEEQEELLSEIISYFLGLGPIEGLLKDQDVSEVMVNGPKQIYVERKGNLELSDVSFRDEEHLMYFVEKILSPLGRRATEFEPYVDARLKDGSRVNIVRSPVSSIGTILTIRKFSRHILNIDDLINLGALDVTTAQFLKACVVSKLNILVSGGASTGKTTLLNVLASFIPEGERVITIEDTLELSISRRHVLPLETRQPNIEGKGEITIKDLIKNSLHMRPDRIIVGEIRSDEVLGMIQAMNTGHKGSMGTLHANSPLEAMHRLEVLALMGNPNISSEVARRQVISAIDLLVHTVRFPEGARKITKISQVVKADEYLLEDIIVAEDRSTGGLKFTGKIPTFYPELNKKANYFCKEFEGK